MGGIIGQEAFDPTPGPGKGTMQKNQRHGFAHNAFRRRDANNFQI